MGTFTASGIIPAYEPIAEEFGVSITSASYLTSLQIMILGVAPFIWLPLSKRFGRRPIFLLSLICSLVCNVGCAKSMSYSSMAVSRALVAFFISPAGAIGSGVVQETFFKSERARYMGVWTLLLTIGVPLSPFIFGFVTQRVGYRWIYWTLAIVRLQSFCGIRMLTFIKVNGVQFVLYLFFGPETRYLRGGVRKSIPASKPGLLTFRRIDPTPLSLKEILHPIIFFARVRVLIPAVAYAMVFLFGSVLTTVETPTLFIPKFGFGPQTIGIQFLALIIGSVIGEQVGGRLSDYWMTTGTKRNSGKRPSNEFRLWLSYPGYLLEICGIVVFLVMTEELATYNVSPIIGAGIAAAGNQIVTTVLITYSVDCYPDDAASVGVFITFIRQTWGFIGPFWYVKNINFWHALTVSIGFRRCSSLLEKKGALESAPP